MKKIIKNSIQFLVNSNIWIALATVAFYELSLLQLGVDLKLNSTDIFLFFSTLFIYNLFRILGENIDPKSWYVKNYNYTKTLSYLSFFASSIAFFFIDKYLLPVILLAGILTILYVGPFSINRSKRFNLRKFWFLKSIIVSLVWVLLTVVLPLLENNFLSFNFSIFSLEKFFFILGITIPYDIKDLLEDKSNGVHTVVGKFGVEKTKWISNSILLLGLVLAIYMRERYLMAVVFVYLTAMYLNFRLDEQKDELWYTFLVDGTIILYFLAVLLYAIFFS